MCIRHNTETPEPDYHKTEKAQKDMLIDLYESLIPSPNLTEPLLEKDLYQSVSRNPLSEKKHMLSLVMHAMVK